MIGTDLFTPHRPSLHRYAFSLVRDPDRAEDLVQDTLLKAYDAFDGYHVSQPLLAWLKQIMLHRYIDTRRGKARHEDATCQIPYPGFEFGDGGQGVFRDRGPSTRALSVALQSLDTLTRECVVMWSEGWVVREIAEMKGFRTVVACKSRIRRGRLRLRALLEIDGE